MIANRFLSNSVYLIEVETGKVKKEWDFTEVVKIHEDYQAKNGLSYNTYYEKHNAVLNGIAYDYSTDSFMVTGKDWDLVFKIKLDLNV